ncbi:MOSC N-terminal beta barrel domain-containing protein (plasmid) [Agrobacterium salinitolerans]|nr:MOSC N-terminal beta barrel domain-containing protein [Agrobacterium salinitolerans]
MMTERIRPMPAFGKIVEIWRYPVSSLGGEICHEADISLNGITGDRRFGLFDPVSGVVAAPEKTLVGARRFFLRAPWMRMAFVSGFQTDDGYTSKILNCRRRCQRISDLKWRSAVTPLRIL